MRKAFREFLKRPDDELDLVEGAFHIAREKFQNLDPDRYQAVLGDLGMQARNHATLPAFNRFFFEELKFRGNTADYYSPDNSFIHRVIELRTGIPITLSIVYCDLARRAGLEAHGVGFPGRYLVKCEGSFVDCFDGRIAGAHELQALLDSFYGGQLTLSTDMVRPAGHRETLVRVVNNLKGAYLGLQDFTAASRIIDLSEKLLPGQPDLLRDRGMIHAFRLEFGKALASFDAYLEQVPEGPDADSVRRHIEATRRIILTSN